MQPQALNIDLSTYIEDAAAKTARFVKIDGVVYYAAKGFNPKDGKPTPIHSLVDVEVVRNTLNAHVKGVEILTQVLQDIEAAKELMPDA